MKKLLSLLVFSSLLLCSCKDQETTDGYVPTISLLTPHENDAFDLDVVDKISFTWATEGITAFKVLLSLTEDLADPQITLAANNAKDLTADELDAQLTALGVNKGEEAKVYWSVQPAGSLIEAETQVRSVRITRKPEPVPPPPPPPTIALSSPADNAQLNANTIAYPFQFIWVPDPAVSEYVLKIAADAGFTAPVTLYDGAGYTFSLDEDGVDNLLAGAGVAHDGQITLYWTVLPKDGNPEVVTQTRAFTMVRKAAPDQLALLAPAADGRFCINEISASAPYEFSWTAVASETQGYTLKFSADDFSTEITRDAGNNTSFTLSRAEAETLFSDLGVSSPAQIKWTVAPKTASVPPVEKRTLNFYKWEILLGPTHSQACADTRMNLIDGDVNTQMIISGASNGYTDYYIDIDLLYTRNVKTITVPANGPGYWGIALLNESKTEIASDAFDEWEVIVEHTLVANLSGRYIRINIWATWMTPEKGVGPYEAIVTFND